jgi:hypothetical protein
MREDKPSESNTSSGWVEKAGRWMAGGYQPQPNSPQTSRGQGNSRTSEISVLVRDLRKLHREDIIEDFVDQWGRANQAEEKLYRVTEDLKAAQEMNSSLQEQIAGQNTDIRKAQETVFATLASAGPKAEDDDVIRGNIRAATKLWKQFAKRWALKHIDDIKDEDKAKELFDNLWADTEFAAHDGLNAKNNMNKAPYVLLNAELARFVSEFIIKAPFTAAFGLGRCDDGTGDSFATANALVSVYDLILKGAITVV